MVGDMDDFPFNDTAAACWRLCRSRSELKYADGWPFARQLNAVVHFDGRYVR